MNIRNMKKLLFILLALLMPMVSDAKKAQVRYATFNIRYINGDDEAKGYGWSVRRDRVAEMILDKDFDIVGVQEALRPAIDDLLERLPGYDFIGVGREDGKDRGEFSPLFYKKDKYEVLDCGSFFLNEHPDTPGLGWDAACARVASWGKFRDKKTGRIIMGVNTHFDHVGTEARRQSALLIIQKIKEIVGKKPAVVTGDFNITDEAEAYKTITTNEFVLRDAYKICDDREGVNYTYQGFSKIPPKKAAKIDFIFVTPNIKVQKVHVAPDNPSYIVSDHNPHWAELKY